jgi:hypothetical protein
MSPSALSFSPLLPPLSICATPSSPSSSCALSSTPSYSFSPSVPLTVPCLPPQAHVLGKSDVPLVRDGRDGADSSGARFCLQPGSAGPAAPRRDAQTMRNFQEIKTTEAWVMR